MSDNELADFRAGQLSFRANIVRLMNAAEVDVWVTPATAGPAPAPLELTDWGGMTTVWSFAGLPCVTVPAGRSTTALPLGLQCVAAFGQDELLLRRAEGIARSLSEPPRP